MDDWRLWLTREEHEHASIEQLKKLLAAERALMEKKNAGLKFYANGEWSDGYPGGVKVRDGNDIALDFGECARAAFALKATWEKP